MYQHHKINNKNNNICQVWVSIEHNSQEEEFVSRIPYIHMIDTLVIPRSIYKK